MSIRNKIDLKTKGPVPMMLRLRPGKGKRRMATSEASGAAESTTQGGDRMVPEQLSPEAVDEERVLVLDPYGRNTELICQTLRAAGVRCQAMPTMDTLLEALAEGAGALLLCPRVLDERGTARLRSVFAAQPAWSSIPLLIFLPDDESRQGVPALVEELGNRANVVTLPKPLWPTALVTAVQAALRARRRQYEVRALQETLEQRVAERTALVRRLAAELTRAEQQERQRISQMLHDDLQQLLYTLQIQLQMAVAAVSGEEQPELAADLGEMAAVLVEAMDLTRTLTVELSPPTLHVSDLGVALSSLAVHMAESYELAVEVETEEACVVPDESVRLLLLQGVRELLFNAVKHAGVDRAQVRLWQEEARCVIEVQDEGAGFDFDALQAAGTGFGLPRVAERMALLGGEMVVDAAPAQGTRVRLVVPARATVYGEGERQA